VLVLAGVVSGVLEWCWTQAACLLELHGPMRLRPADAARVMWRLLLRGGWGTPAGAPGAWAYLTVALCALGVAGRVGWWLHLRVRS
jgi:hypothetical protein